MASISVADVFTSFQLPSSNQRVLGSPLDGTSVLPYGLRPNDEAITLDAAIEKISALQAKDGSLTSLLAKNGGVLFRGLPVHSADDFSRVLHALGFTPHEIIGVVVDRPLLAANVAPANEARPEVRIYNHNESSQVPHAPEYICFYGHRVPAEGGETPLSSSLELFRRAKEEMPEFIEKLAKEGLLSRVPYHFDQQYKGGSTLKQAFGKHITDDDDEATRRAKIEAQIARYGRGKHTTWEWTAEGVVVTHRIPVIRTQPGTNLPTLFTALAAYWLNSKGGSGTRKPTTRQLFGDGSPIPEEYLETLARITDEIKVLHKWQRGDVLVLDNIVAQHGREPWKREQADRVIMASLWDGPSLPGAYTDADWAQVVQPLEG